MVRNWAVQVLKTDIGVKAITNLDKPASCRPHSGPLNPLEEQTYKKIQFLHFSPFVLNYSMNFPGINDVQFCHAKRQEVQNILDLSGIDFVAFVHEILVKFAKQSLVVQNY